MLKIEELEKATKGKCIKGGLTIKPSRYETDSREIQKGDFFIPLKGERVDSHCYIIDCVKKGCIGFFMASGCDEKHTIIKECIEINPDICIIEVEDTLRALINAAIYNRQKHITIPIVAVTGSVGKTSTREMIASVLKQEKRVLVTEKNYNSDIGCSLMCLQIEDQDICVLEAGIDKFDEMEELSNILKPDIVVITLIGTSHIGTFKTKEAIFEEKIKLINHINGRKKVITNGDDIYLSTVTSNNEYEVEKCSIDQVGEIESQENNITFVTRIYGDQVNVILNEIGNHNIYNALMAIKVAECVGIKKENILKGIADYQNFKGRMQKIEVNGVTLIDDTYNASNESMRSGLFTINRMPANKRIAVLGDMLDLGDCSDEIHEKLAEVFEITDYTYLYTLGEQMKLTAKEASKYIKEKNIKCFEKKEELIASLLEIIKPGDIVYFKASNGMKFTSLFKEVVEKIK